MYFLQGGDPGTGWDVPANGLDDIFNEFGTVRFYTVPFLVAVSPSQVMDSPPYLFGWIRDCM